MCSCEILDHKNMLFAAKVFFLDSVEVTFWENACKLHNEGHFELCPKMPRWHHSILILDMLKMSNHTQKELCYIFRDLMYEKGNKYKIVIYFAFVTLFVLSELGGMIIPGNNTYMSSVYIQHMGHNLL
jgi:hypothetical protein